MNIALLLEMAAGAAPDRTALVCDGKRWTYGELLEAARGARELIADSGASCELSGGCSSGLTGPD